jgi:hypothetical protein
MCNVNVQKTADNKPRKDMRFKTRLDALQIRCATCDWTGLLRQVQSHVCPMAVDAPVAPIPVPDDLVNMFIPEEKPAYLKSDKGRVGSASNAIYTAPIP